MSRVPFLDLQAGAHELRPALDAAYRRVMDGGMWVLGPEVEAFERAFAARCATGEAIGVGSGLDALAIALRALGVGPGDEVIVPAHTFIATWLAVTRTGATPVPAEVDPRTLNLDPAAAAAAVTARTAALLPVHLYGQPADMDALGALAARHGLAMVEDAAQAHGAAWRGAACGSLGDAAAFSFYPGKNLGAFGDGGAITTSDPALAERARLLRNYGSVRKYHHDVPGENSRLDALQAALLAVKLPALDAWNARRTVIAATYLEALDGLEELTLPFVAEGAEPSWHLFTVRHPQRDALQAHLAAAGIETLVHYPVAPHRSGAYAELGLPVGAFAVTEDAAATLLSLPIGPHLTDAAAGRVVEAVIAFETGIGPVIGPAHPRRSSRPRLEAR